MNIIMRLFRYAFLIAVIAVFVLGYVYREDLFPGLFDDAGDTTQVASQSSDEAVESKTSDVTAESTQPVSPDTSVAVTSGVQMDTSPTADSGSAAEISTAKQATETSGSVRQPALRGASPVMPQHRSMPPQQGMSPQQAMNQYRQTMPQMDQNNRAMQHRISPEQKEAQEKAAKMFKLISDARQAFWSKKYEEAEKHYQSIIALEPGNPDLTGEVGNFYYAQGKWEKAADSYYKCAMSLLDARRFGQAVYISKIVRGLNKDLADKLDKKRNEIRNTK